MSASGPSHQEPAAAGPLPPVGPEQAFFPGPAPSPAAQVHLELHRSYPPDPDFLPAQRLGGLIGAAVLSTLLLAGVPLAGGWLPGVWGVWAALALWAVLAAALLGRAWWWPILDLRHRSWQLTERGLEIRHGVLWREVVVVPCSRIQHADVTQGPVSRRFGLGELALHTAGTHASTVTLEGITFPTAIAVRDHLLDRQDPADVAG